MEFRCVIKDYFCRPFGVIFGAKLRFGDLEVSEEQCTRGFDEDPVRGRAGLGEPAHREAQQNRSWQKLLRALCATYARARRRGVCGRAGLGEPAQI